VIPPYIISPVDAITERTIALSKVTYAPSSPQSVAVAVAQQADLAIVFVAAWSGEGEDRTTLSLGSAQDSLVAAVAQAQPNTVVVVHTPGPVLMPWVDEVRAIVCAFFPGQMNGDSLTPVLFGDYNPAGRLPISFPVSDNQTAINTPQQYPGINLEANYSEGLFMGYRFYDHTNQAPLFPFGHGLSYSTFLYTNGQVQPSGADFNVTVTVENTGPLSGEEVVQLYVSYPEEAEEPPKILRGFEKVFLDVGQKEELTFVLTPQLLSVWNVTSYSWSLVSGAYSAMIGASSRDIRLTVPFTV